jgi:hypothetical protein
MPAPRRLRPGPKKTLLSSRQLKAQPEGGPVQMTQQRKGIFDDASVSVIGADTVQSVDRMITPSTKVADLLKRYPELEDLLISMAPPFRKLKNPVLRRSVAKVASLSQAAAVARLPVADVVNKLRSAVGQPPMTGDGGGS